VIGYLLAVVGLVFVVLALLIQSVPTGGARVLLVAGVVLLLAGIGAGLRTRVEHHEH
jgi:hypothetical protein